jgi:hypothetical protein
MAKIINEGLAVPGHPVYKQGWTSYIGPRQNEPPSETASQDTPPKKSEENQDVEVQKTEE